MSAKMTEIDKLISLCHAAEADPGDAVAEEQDAREQGDGAGSTVSEAGGGEAERTTTEASPDALEAVPADDGTNPIPGSTVEEEENAGTTDTGPASGAVDIVKEAEAQAAVLDKLADNIMKSAATELVQKVAEAEQTKQITTIVHQAAGEIAQDLNVDPQTSGNIAVALASGQMSRKQYGVLRRANAELAEVSRTFKVSPEDVKHAAEEIGQEAIRQGLTPEQVIAQVVGTIKTAAVEAAMPQIQKEYDAQALIVKKAGSEGSSPFKVKQAQKKMTDLMQLAEAMEQARHQAMDEEEVPVEDEEVPVDEEEVPVEELAEDMPVEDVPAEGDIPEEIVGDEEVAEGDVAEEDIANAVADVAAEEEASDSAAGEIAADEGVAAEGEIDPAILAELAAATEQLQGLEGVDESMIKQAIAETVLQQPLHIHQASAEACLKEDPKAFCRLFIEATLREVANKKR